MIKKTFFSISAIVISLILIELILQGAVSIKHKWEDGPINPRVNLTPYRDRSWTRQLFKEIRQSELQYIPYLDSRTRAFQGIYVNVDSNGFRRTCNRLLFGDSLLIFGGSTVWGYGARDSNTIPSLLSQRISSKGFKITTLNCGEMSYSFTQEMTKLIFLLRDGHRPKYVIFYHGANDVFLTYYYGFPGKNIFTRHFEESVDLGKKSLFYQMSFITWKWITFHSKIYKAISIGFNLVKKAGPPPNRTHLASLAYSYRDYYKKNFLLLQQLSKIYHFKLICFWQPVIQTKKLLTDEEKIIQQPVMDDMDGQLYTMINQLMVTDSSNYFFKISNIFDENTNTIFSDNIHITEEGNQIVADKIFEIVLPILHESD